MATQAGGGGGFPQAGGAGGFAQFGQQASTVSTASAPQGQFGMQNGGFGVPQQPAQPNPAAAGGWGAFGAAPPATAPPAYPGTVGGVPLSQAQGLFATGNQFGGKPVVAPQMGQAAFTQAQPQQFGGWPAQPPAAGGNPFMVR